MTKRILKEHQHTVGLTRLGKDPTHADIQKALEALLGSDEIHNILVGFKMETLTMEVQTSHVKILRNSGAFMEAMQLDSSKAILSAKWIQIASFVVEMVLFILSVIGIRVDICKVQMQRIIKGVVPLVQSRAYQRIIATFLTSWRDGSTWHKATAIFIFLKDTYSFGILWNIIKMVIANMSIFDKIKAIAEVIAMLIAAFATDGLALIAKIALALNDAVNIVEKIKNLKRLEELLAEFKG